MNIQWYEIDRNVHEKLSIYKEFDWCQDILFVLAFAYHCISHVSSPIYNFHISITGFIAGFCVLYLYKTGPGDRLNYNINNFVFAYIGKGNRLLMASRCVHFNPFFFILRILRNGNNNNNNDNTEIDWFRWKLEPLEFQSLIGQWAWDPRILDNTNSTFETD